MHFRCVCERPFIVGALSPGPSEPASCRLWEAKGVSPRTQCHLSALEGSVRAGNARASREGKAGLGPPANAYPWGWRAPGKSAFPPGHLQRGVMWTMRRGRKSLSIGCLLYTEKLPGWLLCLTSGRVHYHTHYTVG